MGESHWTAVILGALDLPMIKEMQMGRQTPQEDVSWRPMMHANVLQMVKQYRRLRHDNNSLTNGETIPQT